MDPDSQRAMFTTFKQDLSLIFKIRNLEDPTLEPFEIQELEELLISKNLDGFIAEDNWELRLSIFSHMVDFLIKDTSIAEERGGSAFEVLQILSDDLNSYFKIIKELKMDMSKKNLQEFSKIFNKLRIQMKQIFGTDSEASQLIKEVVFEPIEILCETWDEDCDLRINIFTGEIASDSVYEELSERNDEDLGKEIIEIVMEQRNRYFEIFYIFMKIQSSEIEKEYESCEQLLLKNFQVQMKKFKMLINAVGKNKDETYNYKEIGKTVKNIHEYLEKLIDADH